MRLYISGKITGDEGYLKKFSDTQVLLQSQGYEVVNPALLGGVISGVDWNKALYAGVNFLIGMADGIVMLEDWQDSKGACMELGMALGMEMPVYLMKDREARGPVSIEEIFLYKKG